MWLPAFHGPLGVRLDEHGRAGLALEETYLPPFGRLGRLADRVLLGRLARRSARELLAALARGLDHAPYSPREASLPRRSAR